MAAHSLAQKIRKMIAEGELLIGKRLPSERRISAEFGVSRLAVQAALKELESEGLVLRSPKRRPIVLANGKTTARTKPPQADQIAIWMLPDSQDLGGVMMIRGIQAEFGNGNYRLLVGCPPSSDTAAAAQAELDFLQSLAKNPSVAGAIVWNTGTPGSEQAYASLIEDNLPIVFIDREPPTTITADVVCANHQRAARNAVQHLIELGHTRIAMVVGIDRASSVKDRIDGYHLALMEAGITPDVRWPYEFRRQPTEDVAACALRTLNHILSGPQPPTAIFAANDGIALQLKEAARELNLSIPDHFSLMGFDWLMRVLPSGGDMTSVSQPFDLIGRMAAQRLLARISNPSDPPRHVMFNAPVVIKQSTGRPILIPSPLTQYEFSGDQNEKTQQSVYAH